MFTTELRYVLIIAHLALFLALFESRFLTTSIHLSKDFDLSSPVRGKGDGTSTTSNGGGEGKAMDDSYGDDEFEDDEDDLMTILKDSKPADKQ